MARRQDEATVGEVVALVRAYARQETLEPLRGLLRFVVVGVVGSLLVGTGLVVLLVACLRLLETETAGAFRGTRSWLAYVVVAVLALGLGAGFAWRTWRGAPAARGTGRSRVGRR
jgi:H+/Cl- antiporter ClcA